MTIFQASFFWQDDKPGGVCFTIMLRDRPPARKRRCMNARCPQDGIRFEV